MSDHRAIAGVTLTLEQLLRDPVEKAGPGAVIRTGTPPKEPGASPLVNIFLYQVRHNPSWRPTDLPVRGGGGQVISTLQAALDLHYLLSFHGDESRQLPQRLLGAVVATLLARSRLAPADIPELLDGESLADSGLREQLELLRFVPEDLTFEELSRIWSAFPQVPYALSTAYRCSVVLIDAEPESEPVPAQPPITE